MQEMEMNLSEQQIRDAIAQMRAPEAASSMTTPKPGPGGARPGAGRPRTYPNGTVSRTLSLDPAADEAMQAHATEHGMSLSAAASALMLYGTAWVQERAAKRAT